MQLRVLLLLLSLAGCGAATAHEATATATTTATKPPAPEPAWGRIYLRRGLAPIQYFRDRYGGPMVAREVEFVFPRREADRVGCELLPDDEQRALRAANGSAVLVLDRGVCSFETKSRLAQQMGAAALVVVSEDESAKAPVAIVDKEEIRVASVMVRKSAGAMLRVAAARERVFGRLVPIQCARKPHSCKPRTADEAQYVSEQTARSGVVVARSSNATLGDLFAATYGSILPSMPLVLPRRDVAPIEGCGEIDPDHVAGKVALFSASTLHGCSTLAKVSSAQRAGAVAALLAVGELPMAMKHPDVEQSWHAYNITIPAAAISSGTLDKLVQQAEEEEADVEIYLELRNRIADAWDQVRRLSVKTAWPTRKDRQEKLLQRVVGSFELDDSQLLELKHHYLTIAGGSGAAWDHALALVLGGTLASDNHDREQPSEVTVDVAGV